jgi:DNA-binding NtrC family response regulator
VARVVHRAITAAVAATKFLTASNASKEAFKTASLLKTLSVNALILGERGTGKKTLAQYIMPTANIMHASAFEELLLAISTSDELIITDIDESPNLTILLERIDKSGAKIIATGSSEINRQLDNFFALKIKLPPLSDRIQDVEALIGLYLVEMQEILNYNIDLDTKSFKPDLSENSISLKRQIFTYALLNNITEETLMLSIEKFLQNRLGTNNDYRNNLHIYEVPLLRAGLKKFKSQLQLADKLGLNRNTLRKKISENSEHGL